MSGGRKELGLDHQPEHRRAIAPEAAEEGPHRSSIRGSTSVYTTSTRTLTMTTVQAERKKIPRRRFRSRGEERLECQEPEPRPAEDGLHNDRAVHEPAHLDACHRHDREHSVPEDAAERGLPFR